MLSALHPPLTLRAVADLDVEAAHDRAHHGQLFLILRRHAGHFDRAAAVRTRRRDRRRVGLVDPRRARAAAVAAILRPRPPAGTPAASLRPVLGKRGRLAVAGAARRGQLLLQVVDPMLQAVVLALQAVVLALQAVVLASPGLVVALASRQLPAKPFEVGAQIGDRGREKLQEPLDGRRPGIDDHRGQHDRGRAGPHDLRPAGNRRQGLAHPDLSPLPTIVSNRS